MNKSKEQLNSPQRPDSIYLQPLIKNLFSQRIGIIAMLLICGGLIAVIMMLLNKPIQVAVVNNETGQTFFTNTKNLDMAVLEKQLLFYSRQFCEDLYGRNHVSVRANRMRALDVMHPNLQEGIKKNINAEINVVVKEMWNDNISWNVTTVTAKSDPRYSVYCQFDVSFERPGYESVSRSFNIKLDWGRLVKNADPFKRPHSLVLLKVQELEKDSDELKKQLNLSF